MLTAITRGVSATLGDCLLKYRTRQEIDIAQAIRQHDEYERCLAGLGVRVVALPADPELPDGVFVEDPAVVVDEVAVLLPMGTEVRRKEVESLGAALREFRPIARLDPPAKLEGGDVMRIGKTLYVGESHRSNREGAQQLTALLGPLGYRIVSVRVTGCLHLKSACCYAGNGTILANRAWIKADPLGAFRILDVPADEPGAANVLRIGETVLLPKSFPRTRDLLERWGFPTQSLDISELQKAEAALTCSSILFEWGGADAAPVAPWAA